MASWFCFKPVILSSSTPRTFELGWPPWISISNLSQLLLICVSPCKMSVILLLDVFALEFPDSEELITPLNEYKLEHLKLEY